MAGEQQNSMKLVRIASLVIDYYNKEKELKHTVMYDTLTGLPNRSSLITAIEGEIERDTNQPLVLFCIDCDRFQLINDSFGYNTGDRILQQLADKLNENPHKENMVARLNGDKFVVLSKNCEDPTLFIQNIQAIFDQPWIINGKEIYLTVGIGIAKYPADGRDAETLLKRVEKALYTAKTEGRSHVCFFRKESESSFSSRLSLEQDLYHALEKEQFSLYYQPQVNMVTGEIVGAEALMRWKHPVHGYIPPVKFIPLLEDIGLIKPVGEWVLNTACHQQKSWASKYSAPFHMSVNLSPKQFEEDTLVSSVKKALNLSGMNAAHLKLEITESMLLNEEGRALEMLNRLNEIGVGVSIDDFGTGYSSLSYLKRFPIQTIKIDRAFVKDIEQDKRDQLIIKAIIDLSRALNVGIIAEGAETINQINCLREAECHTVQGYFFSQPVPPEIFEQKLPEWTKLAEIISRSRK
ncbi:putative bifunctional diguanylate cyclase/phosphodiesterase [Pseudobacillus wudalianchiensis]|uniref:Diguanylate cyclase n=1 Tax=Pseudobacillus wudalianchiensis TaxID=1743143 RepID=A0A1B9ADN4_9BACI|nr:bifunctional diguanylate cyclase/phosphodiesterase [Bacillus wudalianchiensis]OCA81959.1 hypothetical protein A8F95_14685 [Bacillus wudalianchiensis]